MNALRRLHKGLVSSSSSFLVNLRNENTCTLVSLVLNSYKKTQQHLFELYKFQSIKCLISLTNYDQ